MGGIVPANVPKIAGLVPVFFRIYTFFLVKLKLVSGSNYLYLTPCTLEYTEKILSLAYSDEFYVPLLPMSPLFSITILRKSAVHSIINFTYVILSKST